MNLQSPFRRAKERLPRILPGILFVLLVLAVYADPLFLRRNFAGRDLLAYNLPMEHSVHEAYARGRLPVWMPAISGGRPLLPNPNSGALYPIRPLLSLVPFPLAMRILPIFHWMAAGLGMLLLLRSIGSSPPAAWVGAVSYVFSGVGVSEVFFPNIQAGMALLPWILWAFVRHDLKPTPRVILLSFLFGLDLLAGDIFTVALAILCCLLWTVLEAGQTERVRKTVVLGASVLLGSLMALPQILATALWVPETNRAVLGLKLGEVLAYSISPFRIIEFLVPFPFGSNWELDLTSVWGSSVFQGRPMGLFMSLYAGAFAAIALAATRRKRATGDRFARVLFFVALALSVLPSLVPARWGRLPSPLPLRYPEKLAVGFAFALAILAALLFDTSRRWTRTPRWLLAIAGVFAVLALSAWFWPEASGHVAVGLVGSEPRFAERAARYLPAAFAEGGFLWIATLLALEARRGGTEKGLWISLLLLTAVPIAANRKIARTFREEEVFAPTAFARVLQRVDPHGDYRTVGQATYRVYSQILNAVSGSDPGYLDFYRRNWEGYTPALWGRGTVFNFDMESGDLSRVQSLRRFSTVPARYSDAEAFFGSLALRWDIRYRDQPPLPGYRRFGGDANQVWDEHERIFPDIRLLTKWREETGALDALNAIPKLSAGEIVLETRSRGRGGAPPGRLRILERSPERLILETETAGPTWLFVLRGYWKHRTIRLDGRKVKDVPAQIAFSALAVPPGRHRIDWKERVPGGEVSCWGPVLFALTAILLLLRRRRDAAPIGRRP